MLYYKIIFMKNMNINDYIEMLTNAGSYDKDGLQVVEFDANQMKKEAQIFTYIRDKHRLNDVLDA